MPPKVQAKRPERLRTGPPRPYAKAVLRSVKRLPRDYLFWSLFSFLYANCCCCGLLALLFSIKSRDCKIIGDPEGAQEHGKTARCLNVVALIVTIVAFVIFIILLATRIRKLQNAMNEVQDDAFNN